MGLGASAEETPRSITLEIESPLGSNRPIAPTAATTSPGLSERSSLAAAMIRRWSAGLKGPFIERPPTPGQQSALPGRDLARACLLGVDVEGLWLYEGDCLPPE